MRVSVTIGIVAVTFLGLSSCQAFLPAHSLSEDTAGETLSIQMLTKEMVDTKYGALLSPADQDFLRREPLVEREPSRLIPEAVLAAGLSLVKDFVSNALEAEASKYAAEYECTAAFDDFWTKSGDHDHVQQYRAIEFKRVTGAADKAGGLTILWLMSPSKDGQLITIKPALLTVSSAKAKVLSYQAKDWWTTLWTWALETGEAIDLNVTLKVRAVYRTGVQGRTLEDREVGSLTLSSGGHELGTTKKDFPQASGWIPPIPRSVDPMLPEESSGLGTFKITVTVTEADTSKAPSLLKLAATKVREYETSGSDRERSDGDR